MISTPVPIETLGAEIRARVEAGDKALDKAEQHYIAAGIQLAEAKNRLAKTKEMAWSAFLHTHCRIRRRRADEIIAIGDGRTSLSQLRETNRQRVAAHRERKKSDLALRNAEPETPATVPKLVPEQKDTLGALMEAWEDADMETRCTFQSKVGYVPKDWLEDAWISLLIEKGSPIPGALAERRWYNLGLEPPRYPTSEARQYMYVLDKQTKKLVKVNNPSS